MPHLARLLLALVLAATLHAQTISPHLVGNNLWYGRANTAAEAESSPSPGTLNLVSETGIRLVRIGGINYESGERDAQGRVIAFPDDAVLETWIRRIRAQNAEPMVQVSRYRDPWIDRTIDATAAAARARETVRYLNKEKGLGVRYWSIGNEPFGTNGTPSAAEVTSLAGLFRQVAAAMKEEDPDILIYGVNNAYYDAWVYDRLLGGDDDITGLIPDTNRYHLDGVTWHSYPTTAVNPVIDGIRTLRNFTWEMLEDIQRANQLHTRTGDAALRWGIGEFNSRNAAEVRRFENGQMIAAVYGLAMHYGADFAASWSLRENGATNNRFSFSLTEGNNTPPLYRASYWHTRFVGRHFRGRYAEGLVAGVPVFGRFAPTRDFGVLLANDTRPIVFGSIDGEQITALILNRRSTALPYVLYLNRDETGALPGETRLNLDAGLPRSARHQLRGSVPAHGSELILFRPDRIERTAYSRADYMVVDGSTTYTDLSPALLATPPATLAPVARPDAGLLDDFRDYADLGAQRYWQVATLAGGLASLTAEGLRLAAPALAFSQAAVIGLPTPDLDFFQRGFAVTLDGLRLDSTLSDPEQASFRLALVSSRARSNDADDAFVLRLSPRQLQLAFKTNRPATLAELLAPSGVGGTTGPFFSLPLTGTVDRLTLGLQPLDTSTIPGFVTVRCTIELRGSFGTTLHHADFTARAEDWNGEGGSALALEAQRRDGGGAATSVAASIGRVALQPLTLDAFAPRYSLADDPLWQSLLVGPASAATRTEEGLVLTAADAGQASATVVTTASPRFNFFNAGHSVELADLALDPSGLDDEEAVLRLSLCSTADRAFRSPDALTLRLTPSRLLLGLKVNAPSTDAEQLGASGRAALQDLALPSSPTSLRLALRPVAAAGPAETIFYAVRIGLASGVTVDASGTFEVARADWGSGGDSALAIETRLFSNRPDLAGQGMRARVGSVHYAPWVDDQFATSPSFAAWQLRHLSPAQRADPLLGGPSGAVFPGGPPNLLHYALASPGAPGAGGGVPGPSLRATPDGRPALSFSRVADPRLTYRVQASEDLVTWRDLATSRGADNASGLFEIAYPWTSPPALRAFLRLHVTLDAESPSSASP